MSPLSAPTLVILGILAMAALHSVSLHYSLSNAVLTSSIDNPESQIDFGYRSVHLTTVYAKAVVKEYYGKEQDKSYWYGCSSGKLPLRIQLAILNRL